MTSPPSAPRFQPHPAECPECTLCTSNTPCPQITHSYNFSGDTGLQCYNCSACSHGYKIPPYPRHLHSNYNMWYVHIPTEDKCTSEIMQYRMALAELGTSKVTIFPKKSDVPEDDGALVLEVEYYADGNPSDIMGIARERLRENLRALRTVYEMERFLNLGTDAEVVK